MTDQEDADDGSEYGPVNRIGEILNRHLGPIPESKRSEFYFTNTHEQAAIDIFDIAVNEGRGHFYWDGLKATEILKEIDKSIKMLIELYKSLPVAVAIEIEKVIYDDFLELKIPVHRKFDYASYIFMNAVHDLEDICSGNYSAIRGKHDPAFPPVITVEPKGNLFARAMVRARPKKSIKEPQSKTKYQKVLVVDVLRRQWELCKGSEAPRSIPEHGNDFGDLLTEVLDAAELGGNARAAMDAWRREQDT